MMSNQHKTSRKQAKILKIGLDSTRQSEVLSKIESFLSSRHKFFIVTPNPEIIMLAQKDPELKEALNSADVAIPDGIGLKLAEPNLKIIHGRKMIAAILEKFNSKKGMKIVVLADSSFQRIQDFLESRYKHVAFHCMKGPMLDSAGNPISKEDISLQSDVIDKIDKIRPDILFVAFGAPKQEKWIYKNLSNLRVGGAMIAGGTFDYLSGVVKTPPFIFEFLELEWLWRLLNQPWRVGRIFTAVIVFPLKVLLSRIFPE